MIDGKESVYGVEEPTEHYIKLLAHSHLRWVRE